MRQEKKAYTVHLNCFGCEKQFHTSAEDAYLEFKTCMP